MFHNRRMEHRINSIHKIALKLVYQDTHELTFQELLAKGKSASVHQKNLLTTEIFKSKAGMSPEMMNDIWTILKKCDILGTKNENLWFSIFFKNTVLKTTDIQVLKNSTLHHKISRLGGGGLLQRLSVKISSNIRYTITQSHCW